MAAPRPLLMPKLGLTMTEGVVTRWCVAPRTRFRRGEVVLIVETDKVAHDVEAPEDGVLDTILVAEGEAAPVSAELGTWTLDAAEDPRPRTEDADLAQRFIRATPLARRLAREHGISLAALAPTGPNGRIVADDARAHARMSGTAAAHRPTGGRRTASSYERTMASQLTIAKRDTPHFYLTVDLDVGALLDWRRARNAEPSRPRVTVTHLLVAASARALAVTRHMNRVWRDGELLEFDTIDIGLAVETTRGLTNPRVRDLAGDAFDDIVHKVDDVVARARAGLLRETDVEGGALSLSNAGMHELRYMGSIIPPGQSAILGIGAVQHCFRPGANGDPLLSRELGVVLSADHRVHTGVGALEFLSALRATLSRPESLLTRAPEEP